MPLNPIQIYLNVYSHEILIRAHIKSPFFWRTIAGPLPLLSAARVGFR